jgi:hypothetical protein
LLLHYKLKTKKYILKKKPLPTIVGELRLPQQATLSPLVDGASSTHNWLELAHT